MRQERVAPDRIELTENIVNQQQGWRSFLHRKHARLRNFQREGDRPLLTFGGVLLRVFPLDDQFDIIPMRAHDRLAKARLLAEDVARPIIYHNRSGTCWHPHLKGYVHHENSIYNNWRFETVWLDK